MINRAYVGALESRLFDALQSTGDWMTRRQLGELVNDESNTRSLSPYQVATLNSMVARGLVEMQERTRGAALVYYVYRAKG